MQLSTKYGFAFLCMPKCASTSIEAAIRPYCNIKFTGNPGKHINAKNFNDYILKFHEKVAPNKKIETFCLMRNPVDWLHSWYRYRKRDALKATSPYCTENISFNEFVEAYLKRENRPAFAKLSSQITFLKLTDGSIGVDKIFPMEHMNLVADFLSIKIGKTINIPILNVSPKQKFDLDPELNEKLLDFFEQDFILYNKILAQNGLAS